MECLTCSFMLARLAAVGPGHRGLGTQTCAPTDSPLV